MPILGLMTKREVQAQIESLKAKMPTLDQWLLATAQAEKWSLPDPSLYGNQADLYRKLSWVLAAVDMTAQAAALTPFSVMRLVGNKEPKDIPNHPFEMKLSKPNPLDSRFEFLYATVAFWKLTGNGYWFQSRESEKAPPDELWFIPSQMIKPVPDEQSYIRGYMYYPGDGREIFLQPWQIVHFRRFNPFSRFVGMSAIESIASVAQGDIGMRDWNTKLFKENNARLPGILTFESMIEDGQWAQIKADTREAAKNRQLMMLRGVGNGGVNLLQGVPNQKEMEFQLGRVKNKEEIWAVLAPGLSSMLDVNATEANARTGRATFNEYTVYPMHVMMAEKITNEILPTYGGRPVIGQFEDIRITDRQLQLQEMQEYAKTHTIEEIREKYYSDPSLGDERDDLIPVQLRADSGNIQDVELPPNVTVIPNPAQQQPPPEPGQIPPEPGQENQAMMAAMAVDLGKWEHRAKLGVGKAVKFTTDVLPSDTVSRILAELPNCGSQTAIKALFKSERIRLGINDKQDDAWAVVRAIELAITSK